MSEVTTRSILERAIEQVKNTDKCSCENLFPCKLCQTMAGLTNLNKRLATGNWVGQGSLIPYDL